MQLRLLPLAAALLAAASSGPAQEPSPSDRYLKAFPAAAEGRERFVIQLPHKERGEDESFQVELVVGREMMTDGVNRVRLGGEILSRPLEGWGFTYYEVEKLGPGASTLIGVPPGTPKVKRFVAGPRLQIPYNSRVPIVVYVPEGAEVRYRVWQAPETMEKAPKG